MSHSSRITLLLAIKKNNVHFLTFPYHTVHIILAVDVGVLEPLKKDFSVECTNLA